MEESRTVPESAPVTVITILSRTRAGGNQSEANIISVISPTGSRLLTSVAPVRRRSSTSKRKPESSRTRAPPRQPAERAGADRREDAVGRSRGERVRRGDGRGRRAPVQRVDDAVRR